MSIGLILIILLVIFLLGGFSGRFGGYGYGYGHGGVRRRTATDGGGINRPARGSPQASRSGLFRRLLFMHGPVATARW